MKIVLGTANPDKARELATILSGFDIIPRPPEIPDIEENGSTIEENALIKARTICAATGQVAVADDTGFEVDALNGAPGIYAARYAGEHATYSDNVEKLLNELGDNPNRRAKFRTAAVAVFPEGNEIVVVGEITGEVATEVRGEAGFGYDPIFCPDDGDGRTFAEMSADEKHDVSHRGRAFRQLAKRLRSI